MPTFRDHQITRRGDYQEGEDLETFLSHHENDADDEANDDDYDDDHDDDVGIDHDDHDNNDDEYDNNNNDDEDEDDEDPTIRYKRIYYSFRRTSPQLVPFCVGYVLLGTFVLAVWSMAGGWHFNQPLDVDQGVTNYNNMLKLSNIEHWCRQPQEKDHQTEPTDLSSSSSSSSSKSTDRSNCKLCLNPLLPQDRHEKEHWSSTHASHVQSAKRAASRQQQPQIVFLGDSITEGWLGKSYGQDRDYKQDNVAVFNELFGPSSSYPALPLGIAGDKSPHLLWRMQHGEVAAKLNPSVWWILIGTNDFNKDASCSSEVVIMGIQRVVEEMINLRPNAKIVINSLLPRATDHPQGWLLQGEASSKTLSLWKDIQTVNHAMEEYVQSIQRENRAYVSFFNATSLLIRSHNATSMSLHSKYYIPTEYMSDYLHPSALGYRLWGRAMITFMQTLF